MLFQRVPKYIIIGKISLKLTNKTNSDIIFHRKVENPKGFIEMCTHLVVNQTIPSIYCGRRYGNASAGIPLNVYTKGGTADEQN